MPRRRRVEPPDESVSHHPPTDRELLERIVALLEFIAFLLTPPPVAATIVLTDPQGVPMSSVSLTGTQTVEVAVAVGDADGNIISGDALDPGATVTVDDSAVCTAVLSSDQTSMTVTALNVSGTTNVTVNGSFSGVALTDFGGPLVVTTEASAPAASTIVLTPGTPQGS